MKSIHLIICLCLSLGLRAQILCTGTLLDSTSREALEFVNVGIPGKGIGTVSDEKGNFRLSVPDSFSQSEIQISLIGYKTLRVKCSSLQKQAGILLSPASVKLQEVEVKPKSVKIKVLGNDTKSESVSGGFKSNTLGAELGVRLSIKHKDTYLRKLMFNINRNSMGMLPIFRVNVYRLDKDKMPAENILKENIIVEPKSATGFVEIDLKPYSLFVSEDVVVSIEWIKDLGDAKGLYFSTKLLGGNTYFRRASQDRWEKTSPVGVGLHVEVGY